MDVVTVRCVYTLNVKTTDTDYRLKEILCFAWFLLIANYT